MKNEENDILNELIPRYLVGEASAEEEKQLLTWIAQAPENERQYLSFKKVFELSEKHYTDKAGQTLDINIDNEWNHFISTIDKTQEKPVHTLQGNMGASRLWYKIAATLLLLAVFGFVINYFVSKNNEIHFQTAENTLNVSLPDGSQIILNRRSEVSYSSDFGDKTRTVTLKGEGFFDVAKDGQKPFIINVNHAKVEVLGTSFNVRAYDERKEVEVIVETGVVKVTAPNLSDIKLVAGQKAIYDQESKQLLSVVNEDVNFLSWNTHKLIFEGNSLQTVIETLNKTYGVNIVLATDIPPSCIVTVTFDHQTLEAVLHVLETTLNLTITINGNQIEITGAGC